MEGGDRNVVVVVVVGEERAAIMSTLFSIKPSCIYGELNFCHLFLMMHGLLGLEIDRLADVCNFGERGGSGSVMEQR